MADTLRIAVVQSRIERDINTNGAHIREMLNVAAARGAALALFPEGALSGYAKAQVRDWPQLDWPALSEQLALVSDHSVRTGLTAVIGTAHALPGKRPHNSLIALPQGPRYDKRYLSHTEITSWYTPGFKPTTFERAGFGFGMTICIEMQFPELFAAYEALDVDCILHATYGLGPMGDVILQAHAATNCVWLAVATPANADEPASGILGPDGRWMARCGSGVDIATVELDRTDPRFDIALNKARPWRRIARQGRIYQEGV